MSGYNRHFLPLYHVQSRARIDWATLQCFVLIPVKTPPNHNKRALVCNQPNTSLRPTHPVRTRSRERLHPQTSNGTGIPSQPPRGTPNPHSTHQETETTLDIRWDKMRRAHWTDTWINDTPNTTLAYRELVVCFLIANKVILKKTFLKVFLPTSNGWFWILKFKRFYGILTF